ncbi:hypothetical protein E2C01_039667 [Portunus trituberculatus]|uniref:Uncharacterized protein n=1 Tax=Portunus trituberculatus TaxID=210409 RepID=A0A5B7FHM4_PORTR|nr:hypothetical protein [Portunus trituberculatus]
MAPKRPSSSSACEVQSRSVGSRVCLQPEPIKPDASEIKGCPFLCCVSIEGSVFSHTNFHIHFYYPIPCKVDNPAWRRPRGCPQNSWLWQVDASCWELLGMGREPAWRLMRHDCLEWRHRVCKATRPPACVPVLD